MGKEFSVTLQLQTFWVTEPIGAFLRRGTALIPIGNRSPSCSARSLVMARTTLLQALLLLLLLLLLLSLTLQPPRPRGFLITHNDAPQSVGLLLTSNQLVAETST
jgi:hypothetical protein